MIDSLYEKFQHWSKTGSVWILSDTHFNDADTKLMDPDWLEPEKQVEIINKHVHKTDTLVLLGDVGDLNFVKQLKAGYKVLIMGNHDESRTKFEKKEKYKGFDSYEEAKDFLNKIDRNKYPKASISGNIVYYSNNLFDEIYEGPIFISEKILLSHEPIHGLQFCVNIHGHDHSGDSISDDYHLNLAANVCGFAPVSLQILIKNGLCAKVKNIHRITIDKATERKSKRENQYK